MELNDKAFIRALEINDKSKFSLFPKSDLHIHSSRGCNRQIFEKINNVKFPEVPRFKSVKEMDDWYNNTIDEYASGDFGIIVRYASMLNDFEKHNVTIASPIFCTDLIKHFNNDLDKYINIIKSLITIYAPDTTILPEFEVTRGKSVEETIEMLDRVKDFKFYKSIDLKGDEKLGSKQYEPVYKKAKEMGLILKAHVGEFCDVSSIEEALEYLNLDCITHGISLTQSKELMNYVRDHEIMINCCPSSNYYLSRIEDYESHPIKEFVRNGIICSINTDDPLIFNKTIDDQYFDLYNSGTLTAQELYEVNQNGLQKCLNKRRR